MTPKDIIKMNKGNKEWQSLKISDPGEYLRLSRFEIMKKFEMVVPYFSNWQKNNGEFKYYEKYFPDLNEVLNALNLGLYDEGLEGKKKLTRIFFYECIPYGVDNIISHSLQFDDDSLFKIRNLINRCFSIYYTNRERIKNDIYRTLEIDYDEIERIALFRYIPFKNIKIGIEWMSRRANPTLSDLLFDWLILLCFDNKCFISDEFLSELILHHGEEYVNRILEKLLIYIAGLKELSPIYSTIIKKYSKRINQYRKYLQEGKIVEDITIGDLVFSKKYIGFYKCIMPIPFQLNDLEIKCLHNIIDCKKITDYLH